MRDDIRKERRDLLMKPGTLCTSPLLEPLPSWREDGRTFEDLVAEEGEDAVLGSLSEKARRAFVDLIGCGLIDHDGNGKLYRPYKHQVKMLRRGIRDGQAGIVTSGTGSGKTEAFLLPILASIIEEATRDKGGWRKPEPDYLRPNNPWWRKDGKPMGRRDAKGEYALGEDTRIKGLDWDGYTDHEQRHGEIRPAAIRALILYPMNALVEDQMARLRVALDSQDARDTLDKHLNNNRIFFGRYTGQTKGGPAYLLDYEKALKELSREEGSKKLSERIKGCSDDLTLTKWKNSVTNSRKNRIESVILKMSRLDDLQSAIRKEAGISPDQQVGLDKSKKVKDKAFAFPALDGAEMVMRWDMQEYPPDILVTNISMLNAMLSRKTEACMLEKTREWLESDSRNRFTIVIDELHLQRGSAGTEFIYLLRLLFLRLGLDQSERHHQLRLLASSASLAVDDKDAKNKEESPSLKYLYDAFADFGLRRDGKHEDWFEAIVRGEEERSKSEAQLSVNATDLDKAIDRLMKTQWADAAKNEDNILPEPDFEHYANDFTAFLDALSVPSLDTLEERWEWLASAIGCAIEKACRRDDGSVAATSLDDIAGGIWPKHGWSPSVVERNLRLLTAVVSSADHSSSTGKKLRKLRKTECWPVPRFRLHTFFRNPEGLFVNVVPPDWRPQEKPDRWQGELSIERMGTTTSKSGQPSVRQFELLSCECCGECFVGGIRAADPEAHSKNDFILAELLPNEEDIESLPDLSISNRFEEHTYKNYAIFWPRDKNNNNNFDDERNKEKWEQAWLDPMSGTIFSSEKQSKLQPGYIFKRIPDSNHRKITDESSGSHTPCRCPRCEIDYGPKRRRSNGNLFQFSPIRSQRSSLAKTTQILASELYDVLAREEDSDKARLVSFSDSRQGAARTALGVEELHHRDVLREILLAAIQSQSESNSLALEELQNEIKQFESSISTNYNNPAVVETLHKKLEEKKISDRNQSLKIVSLESILELQSPDLGSRVKPFLAELIKLRIHPFCERGVSKLSLSIPGSSDKRYDWWELFSKNGDDFQWSFKDSKAIRNEDDYKKIGKELLDKILEKIGSIVFNKNYFSLEATGLAYPVPLLSGKGEANSEELNKAAAWMRVYTDDYRYNSCQWEGESNKITPEEVERGRSSIAKLIQSSASTLRMHSEKLFQSGQVLMNRYGGHSDENYDFIRLERIGFKVAKPDDPYWRCSNCGRIHLHKGLGSCTRCGHRLSDSPNGDGRCAELQEDNFLARRLRRSLGRDNQGVSFRLCCEELTGQTTDPASRQQEFKGIQLTTEANHPLKPHGIEMLSVTTTMEVGIDIGPLEAIVQANMPPQRFNYQQRVGRAGRRGQAFSLVLTLCRSRSHDLHYFLHPKAITGDAPPPPFLVKRLPRIAERILCKGQLIAAFRKLEEKHREESGGFWLGDLVKPADIHGDFIPAATLRKNKLKRQWLQWLAEALKESDVQGETTQILEAIKRGNEESDLSFKPAEDLKEKIGENIEIVGENTAGLGAHLANEGLLPMYGLPTRERELVLGPSKNKNIEPTESIGRDLEIAIYEYAPGNVLVHEKKDHLCIGLTPRIYWSSARGKRRPQTISDKPWDRKLQLGQCPKCWVWKDISGKDKLNENIQCLSCGGESFLKEWNRKSCLEPAAFRSTFKPSNQSLDRLPGSYGNSLCADSEPPDFNTWKQKNSDRIMLSLTTNDQTTVYRLNQGPSKKGFDLDWKVGVLQGSVRPNQDAPLKAQAIDKRLLHKNERNPMLIDEYNMSHESLSQVYLVAPRVTDGLYLLPQKINKQLAIACLGDDEKVPYFEKKNSRRSDPKPLSGNRYWQGVRAAAISAAEILVAEATRRMDIERGDLEAVEPRLFRRRDDDEKLPMIQIVDRHVNGAGFSDWLGSGDVPPILDVLQAVFDHRANEWAEEDHKTKCQEACYRCLKSYNNQSLHGLLDWRLGLAYLRSFTDPSWHCGLDGNFEDQSIEQWPEFALGIRESTLNF